MIHLRNVSEAHRRLIMASKQMTFVLIHDIEGRYRFSFPHYHLDERRLGRYIRQLMALLCRLSFFLRFESNRLFIDG